MAAQGHVRQVVFQDHCVILPDSCAASSSFFVSPPGPADVVANRGKPEFHEGGITMTFTSYGAYVVAGNLIIMCESFVEECEALVAQME